MNALCLAWLLLSWPGIQGEKRDGGTGCAVCHGKEQRELEASVHARAGIGCTDCHGGNPAAMEVLAAHGESLRRYSSPTEVVESCGSCHADVERMRSYGVRTDQLSLYWTSRHGQRLAQDPGAEVATCTSCHGTHGVPPANDTRSPSHPFHQVETCGKCHADPDLMSKHGVAVGAVEAYRSSVHGRALLDEGHTSAPSCSDCHGSHGATPPRARDVGQVCGQCHSVVQDHFQESPHARPVSAGASVECVACHGGHGIAEPSEAMFSGDDKGHCGECHPEGAGTALLVAGDLRTRISGLERAIDEAGEDVRDAASQGLFLGPEKGYLDDARGLLVRARSMSHALSVPALEDVLNRGHGMVGQTRESLATKSRMFRDRKIFASVFGAVSLVFAFVLWLYSRTIGGSWKAPSLEPGTAEDSGGGRG